MNTSRVNNMVSMEKKATVSMKERKQSYHPSERLNGGPTLLMSIEYRVCWQDT
jgi:hypothetical protein